jgi:glyoxylase-like metal-dependent hydrolase (beta-lactamase superfamily II)
MTEIHMKTTIRRRTLLKGAAAAALANLAPVRAFAASDEPRRMSVGALEIIFLSDGSLELPVSFALPDRPAAEIAALFAPHGLSTDRLTPPLNVVMVRAGDEATLIDAGSGANFMATAGRLPAALDTAGIDREIVTRIVLTHAHPDHLWGVIDEFDEEAFPNARYLISQGEWDYWTDPDTVSRVPEAAKGMAAGAARILGRIAEKTERLGDGAAVAPGMTYISTPGHTPGHMSVLIEDGAERMMVLGDAVSHAVISFERPDWHNGADVDRDQGAATRKRLLDMLAGEGMPIAGYHLPEPGLGRVERNGTAYRFVAG